MLKMKNISEFDTGRCEDFGCLENSFGCCPHNHLHVRPEIFCQAVVIQVWVRNYYRQESRMWFTKSPYLWQAAN